MRLRENKIALGLVLLISVVYAAGNLSPSMGGEISVPVLVGTAVGVGIYVIVGEAILRLLARARARLQNQSSVE